MSSTAVEHDFFQERAGLLSQEPCEVQELGAVPQNGQRRVKMAARTVTSHWQSQLSCVFLASASLPGT